MNREAGVGCRMAEAGGVPRMAQLLLSTMQVICESSKPSIPNSHALQHYTVLCPASEQLQPSQLLLSLEKLRLPVTNCSTSPCSPLPQQHAHMQQQGGEAENPK